MDFVDENSASITPDAMERARQYLEIVRSNKYKTSYMFVTLERAKQFLDGIQELGDDYAAVKAYVLWGRDIAPELKEKADALQALRQQAISDEMYYLQAQAEEAGIELPEDFINGTALDPYAEPALHDISANFKVFDLFSWYDPVETILFVPRKIIK